jgi:nucleoside triphosphate diphosphatase
MVDELGDVLFQVMFLSLLLEERGEGDLAAVAESCAAKLIRRHPHVYGDRELETAG